METMADNHEEWRKAVATAEVKGKKRDDDDDDEFASSGLEDERPARGLSSSSSSVAEARSSKVFRLLGRERPLHQVLGGGALADVFLWRNKKVSGAVLFGATVIWILFDLLEYHLLTLVGHVLIVASTVLFLYTNTSTFINKSPPHLPEVYLPEGVTVGVALAIRQEINKFIFFLREIAAGHELIKFISVIAVLWVLSIIGGYCNFLTLCYIVMVLILTVPFLYEKYEAKVDNFAEGATVEMKKQYAVLDKKVFGQVLSKIPRGRVKEKKHY